MKELAAKKKHRQAIAAESRPQHPITATNENLYDHSISLQFNTLLYATLQNMVENAFVSGDFTYASVADVVRAAIDAYEAGMQLTELDQPGDRRNLSFRVTKKQHDFYKSWPNRLRRKLLERAVRSFLKL